LNPEKGRRLVNPGKNKKQQNDMNSTIDPHVNIQSQVHYYTTDAITAKPNNQPGKAGHLVNWAEGSEALR